MTIKDGVYKICEFLISDTGWKDLQLASGVLPYSTSKPPQYRKIANTVYLRGSVKGIKADSTLISTLPTGCRPQYPFYFVQNMSYTPGTQGHANFARFIIKADGTLTMQYTSNSFEHDEGDWYDLDCSFLID